MHGKIITFTIILGILLFGCTNSIAPPANDIAAAPDGVGSIVNGNNQFSFDIYSKLGEEEGNLFFSPWSISTALAMAYEGARGQTADEMAKTLHLEKNDNIRRPSIAAVHNQLNRKDAEYKLHTANALWVQKNYKLLSDYKNVIQQYYGGEANNVDFVGATEDARKTINIWIEDKTNNKIKELFPKGSLNSDIRLVITNAIYFKGDWAKQFDKKETRQEDFRVSKDKIIQVPMMRHTDEKAKFNYAEIEELQILEMLYKGEKLSMIILLPKNDDLSSVEESLSIKRLNEWRDKLAEQRVDVYMPKFTFNSKYSLNENLKEMGMPSAFTQGISDFSGIDGTKALFIDKIIHQAFVEVNEEGTEAAAATGVSFGITSIGPPIPTFRADHPFMFIIQERETGNILFLGRVANPSG